MCGPYYTTLEPSLGIKGATIPTKSKGQTVRLFDPTLLNVGADGSQRGEAIAGCCSGDHTWEVMSFLALCFLALSLVLLPWHCTAGPALALLLALDQPWHCLGTLLGAAGPAAAVSYTGVGTLCSRLPSVSYARGCRFFYRSLSDTGRCETPTCHGPSWSWILRCLYALGDDACFRATPRPRFKQQSP